MGLPPRRFGALRELVRRQRLALAALVAAALAGGCEQPFEPIQEVDGAVFSMFGYLNLKADTQWIRVMPVRESLLLEPEPIDAVVTLEHLASGRTVTLADSLFSFPVPGLGSVVYAYNFWTDEALEPGATYRLTATRSDGEATTATIVMPADLEIEYRSGPPFGINNALLIVRAENVLFADLFYALMDGATGERAQSITLRQDDPLPGESPRTYRVYINGDELVLDGLLDLFRREVRLTAATADWPFRPDLSDLEVSLPGTMPSNVENGFGFVGGVAEWTIPYHRCVVVEPRPSAQDYCDHHFDRRSASVSGRVLRRPCGDPHTFAPVRLTERFIGGGAVTRTWLTGWEGEYRFEGIEPGAELVLELGGEDIELPLPRLGEGERYVVEDLSVAGRC